MGPLDMNNYVKAAEKVVERHVPQVHRQLAEFKARKLSRWPLKSIFLHIYVFVASTYITVISYAGITLVQVVILLLAHRFSYASTFAYSLSSVAIAHPCTLAIHNIEHALMHQRWHDKWQDVSVKNSVRKRFPQTGKERKDETYMIKSLN